MIGRNVLANLQDSMAVDDVLHEKIWVRDKPVPATGTIKLQNHQKEFEARTFISVKQGSIPLKAKCPS